MHVFAEGLEKGMCVSVGGCPYVVIDSKHVKYGKGAPFIQAELCDVLSDTTRQLQLHPVERLEKIDLAIKRMRYLRSDGDCSIFADVRSREEAAVPHDLIGEYAQWLEEEDVWRVLYLDGELFAVVPPSEIEMSR